MLIDMTRKFFKDKLRIAVMFALYSLLCFSMWLYLVDESPADQAWELWHAGVITHGEAAWGWLMVTATHQQ